MQSAVNVLHTSLSQTLQQLQISVPAQLHFEHPANSTFGDFSSNVAMMILGKKRLEENATNAGVTSTYKSPRELAEAIVKQLLKQQAQQHNSNIKSITVAGPGFINFTFSDTFLIEQATKITQEPEKRIDSTGQSKDVIVEYSSPNIAKPFTIGHLRSTIIGDAIANILQATGNQVFRDNHLGDWGTQFGKQIYAIKAWGDEQVIDSSPEPVKELVALYIRFHQEAEADPELDEEARKWFKRLEDGDEEARRLWQKCIDWSWKEFQHIYQRLGIHFTENNGRGYGESFFENKMGEVLTELKEKNLLQESEGAQVVFYKDEKYPPLLIVKKDGATLYATRDLATDKFRLNHYGKDIQVINEVGIEQSLYFKQLYELESLLGWYQVGQRIHVGHGHFRFKDQKMSTRKGNVIWLADVLDEAVKRAAALSEQKATSSASPTSATTATTESNSTIGIGALKWNDLKRSSTLDVVFDWDEMLALQGNSGPYMQYTYARCQSVLQKAQLSQSKPKMSVDPVQTNYVLNEEERAVLRLLYRFNEAVQMAAVELAPHHLCTYLFELAQSFNAFYNKHSILGKVDGTAADKINEESIQLRLLITKATAELIQQGLDLLGIQTLEKM